ncbi:bifunctional diguanylate cyclase/phosphodiesterase [Litchfieldella xinjiangensis]|uniref:bifunctional diguanylate cyclase/phosphodiesterase n=1 Tax=Litchfieldella xinjiangensis TaxID=1166948 RepID=UPI00069352A6|nr:EAL domain-containing protein [Halomonas xinjiangensis]
MKKAPPKNSKGHHVAALNRAWAFASRCNHALIHMSDEPSLLKDICNLAVEVGGYRMAWVGYALNDPARTIMPQASAGAELGYLEEVHVSWSEAVPNGCGTAGRAVREGTPQIIPDLSEAPDFQPWREAARVRGFQSIVTLPLKDQQGPFGILTLFQGDVQPVGEEELQLLQELADNLAFGIVTLRSRREQERVQQAVLSIASAVSSRSGDAYFDHLVSHMASSLEGDAAFIALVDETEPNSALTLAALIDGQPVENFRYVLTGTPCERVLLESECVVRDRVVDVLPKDSREALSWARGYVGRRLDNADGAPIGLLVVMYREPLIDAAFALSVMRIFAAGAAAELERQSGEARMRRLAFYDSGTGLPNRTQFMQQLQVAMSHANRASTKLALLFLDLNHFKDINETQGHDIGDKVLVAVAERFLGTLGGGEFLARLGGDEFVVMIEDAGRPQAEQLVLRLKQSLSTPVEIRGHAFTLDASIGVAFYPEHGQTPSELLKSTDIAMHRAKQDGEGYCFFAPRLGEKVSRRLILAKRFIAALNEGRLTLYYQPQVDLESGELVGAEVLCRWYDDELGWVSPAEFIPVAEERGLASALGTWVTETVCRQSLAWRSQGREFAGLLSINVAAQQFEDMLFAERMRGIVAANGVSPERIVLELTEGGFMREPEQAVWLTHELKRAGFGLAIDDFGTGYSSLAYLKRFAADTLKIDMSFVRDMLTDPHDHTIVTTIIAMAKSLGMQTVAEGVETQGQAEALRKLGCDQGQGYYFGRPTDADSFAEQWLLGAPTGAR